MPKGHKRKKNPGVGIDFKRAKHKVGRKLPKAQNETDTTIKSQKLVLAEQSVGIDKTGLATTSRNNTLKELLGQCGHYSEKVRLKALHGLIDLLQEYPLEAKNYASEIVAKTSSMASDSSVQCRDAYCSLLRSALFPALGERALQPFLPYLMGHICSAMTHLSHGIRASGIEMMNVVLEWRPDIVGQRYFTEICQHFIEALGKSSRGRSLSAGSLKNLHSLVQGCHTFLKLTLCHTRGEYDCQGMSDFGAKRPQAESRRQHTIFLQWRKCYWDPSRSGTSSGKDGSSTSLIAQLEHASKLMGVLLECWEECGLTSPEGSLRKDSESVKCGSYILQCCSLLVSRYRTGVLLEESYLSENAQRIFTRVFPFFPSLDSAHQALSDISSISADMISIVLSQLHASGYNVETDVRTAHAVETLAGWCSVCFENSVSDPPAFSHGSIIARNILSFASPSVRQLLLSRLADAWASLPVDPDDRNKGIKFMCEIFTPPLVCYSVYNDKEEEEKQQQKLLVNRDTDTVLGTWLSQLPSFLWKIKKAKTREYTYRLSFLAMLNACRYVNIDPKTCKNLPNITQALEGLTIKIIPLFALQLKGNIVPGPLTKMPEDVQSLAIEVLYSLPGLHKSITGLISDCVAKKGMFPSHTMDRLFEVLFFKSQYGDPEQVWGLIYSIIQGSHVQSCSDVMNTEKDWDFENFLLNRISRIALHCSPTLLALQSILPPMLADTTVQDDVKVRSSYGALYFLHQCLLLNQDSSTLELASEVLEKIANLIATLPVFAQTILGNSIISPSIDTLAQETMKLLISQCEHYVESVMKCIKESDDFGRIQVLLRLLLGALDHVECDPTAVHRLKAAYPQCMGTIDGLRRKDKCPEDILTISSQLMVVYKTTIH